MSDYDPNLDDPLLQVIESILQDDIPDPNRRRAVAGMIRAHTKAATVHSLRNFFDPFLGIGAVKPTVEEALMAMRGAVIRLAGFDRDDPDRWNKKQRSWDGGPGVGDDRNDQGNHRTP